MSDFGSRWCLRIWCRSIRSRIFICFCSCQLSTFVPFGCEANAELTPQFYACHWEHSILLNHLFFIFYTLLSHSLQKCTEGVVEMISLLTIFQNWREIAQDIISTQVQGLWSNTFSYPVLVSVGEFEINGILNLWMVFSWLNLRFLDVSAFSLILFFAFMTQSNATLNEIMFLLLSWLFRMQLCWSNCVEFYVSIIRNENRT